MIRLARFVSPALDAKSNTSEGRKNLTGWTRGLTAGLALIQSYGFASFVQAIPGAVAHPGAGFIAQTMLVLTSGSLVMMALSERIAGMGDGPSEDPSDDPPARDSILVGPGAATVVEKQGTRQGAPTV